VPLDAVWTGSVLVLDHLLRLVGNRLVDLLKGLLRGEQIVRRQEFPAFLCESVELPGVALPALVVVQGDLLDDAGVDELLDMLVYGGITHAGVELLEFVHRGELVGVLKDVVDQREPRLLGDEVDEFAWCCIVIIAQTGAHSCVFDREWQSSLP